MHTSVFFHLLVSGEIAAKRTDVPQRGMGASVRECNYGHEAVMFPCFEGPVYRVDRRIQVIRADDLIARRLQEVQCTCRP